MSLYTFNSQRNSRVSGGVGREAAVISSPAGFLEKIKIEEEGNISNIDTKS
jgi:hypothetical protein